MPPTNKIKRTRQEILEKKRDAERARYQKIKADPVKLAEQKEKERLKYLKKKEQGARKNIAEMTLRQQRKTRKQWRAYSAAYQAKQKLQTQTDVFMREITPPDSGDGMAVDRRPLEQLGQNLTPRAVQAKKRALKQRKKRNRDMKKKDATILKLKTKLNTYRQKISRLKVTKKSLSPRSKLLKLSEDPKTRKEVVEKALFGQVIEEQVRENYSNLKSHREKKLAKRILLGGIVEKNKLWRIENSIITYKKSWCLRKKGKRDQEHLSSLKKMVQTFLEDDMNSRLCAGRKEFVVRNKMRQQKRYLSDTLTNLHKKFLNCQGIISYSLFCRFRPFWIVAPKVTDRDTCLCILHSNIQLILDGLCRAKILNVPSYQSMLLSLCCDRFNEKCLMRVCKICCTKTLPFKEFDNTKKIAYKQWISSKESFIDHKTKQVRNVVKQKKQLFEILPRDLIIKLENDVVKFFNHELNIVHQYTTIKALKSSLTEKDILIHMDFSENYSTKYNQEIQSFHFGGSRMQISLHTVVVYFKNSVNSFCTISSNLSHNVPAIWAHSKPVLATIPSTVDNIHFLSDGPVTQYRNKMMFFALACKMSELCPGVIYFSWNYHEAGHGKGAPDGIGAVCKRTADHAIATGRDITNLEEFRNVIQERCPSVTVYTVTDLDISEMNNLISADQSKLNSFKGTLKVHQITGTIYSPGNLSMKSLSCFCDKDGCTHFKLGTMKYTGPSNRLSVADVYSDSDVEETELTGTSNTPTQNSSYVNGEYILVRFLSRKKEYRYAAICTDVYESDCELKAMFLKVCDRERTTFKVDDNNIAAVGFDDIICKLPNPTLQPKGGRVYYQFKTAVDVREQ